MRLVDWKMNEGKLQAGMVVKMPSGDICYVVSVSPSSALIRYVSGYDKPITTRKGVTKIVTAHRHDAHISVNVCILCVDPNSEYALRIREKMTMTEAVAEQTTETTETESAAEGDPVAGKEVFLGASYCGGCHTLADAGATGAVGPNLDETKPSFELALDRVTNGLGGMPSFSATLTEQQLADVAAYVSSATAG